MITTYIISFIALIVSILSFIFYLLKNKLDLKFKIETQINNDYSIIISEFNKLKNYYINFNVIDYEKNNDFFKLLENFINNEMYIKNKKAISKIKNIKEIYNNKIYFELINNIKYKINTGVPIEKFKEQLVEQQRFIHKKLDLLGPIYTLITSKIEIYNEKDEELKNCQLSICKDYFSDKILNILNRSNP